MARLGEEVVTAGALDEAPPSASWAARVDSTVTATAVPSFCEKVAAAKVMAVARRPVVHSL